MSDITLLHGDCLRLLPTLAAGSVDAIVTDPPYALTNRVIDGARCHDCGWGGTGANRFRKGACPQCGGALLQERAYRGKGFLGKDWDNGEVAFRPEVWVEALRVAKPGAHMVAFGGTRTSHRLVSAIEDAGWEIRDSLVWLYGQGMPKSLDIGKAFDKAAGDAFAWRAFADAYAGAVSRSSLTHADIDRHLDLKASSCYWARKDHRGGMPPRHHWDRLKTFLSLSDSLDRLYDEAEREVISQSTAYRPKTTWQTATGTFAAGEKTISITAPATDLAKQWDGWGTGLKPSYEPICLARKPPVGSVARNVAEHGTGGLNIDGCRVGTSDTLAIGSGMMGYGGANGSYPGMQHPSGRWPANAILDESAAAELDAMAGERKGDSPTRKPRRHPSEGNDFWQQGGGGFRGQDGMDYETAGFTDTGGPSRYFYTPKASPSERGGVGHPTVKPLALMRWLVRLITPPGGLVLDMFCGSGSTGLACIDEGMRFIGIDVSTEYIEMARARIADYYARTPLFAEVAS